MLKPEEMSQQLTPPENLVSNIFEPTDFDAAVGYHENFYLWCNGGWLKRLAVLEEFSKWSVIDLLRDLHNYQIKDIINELLLQSSTSDVDIPQPQKNLINFYSSFMDMERVEDEGFNCIRPIIALCENIADDVTETISKLHSLYGVNALFCLCSMVDKNDSGLTTCAIFLDAQWGYFISRQHRVLHGVTPLFETNGDVATPWYKSYNDVQRYVSRNKYVEYIKKTFALLGERGVTRYSDTERSKRAAVEVMELKSLLSAVDLDEEDYRDPMKINNKVNFATLDKMSNAESQKMSWSDYLTKGSVSKRRFDWTKYFKLLGKSEDNIGTVNVPNLMSLRCFEQVLNSPFFVDYLIFQCIESFSDDLPNVFSQTKDTEMPVLSTHLRKEPRWKRAIRSVEEYFGDTVGKLYMDKRFTPDSWNFLLNSVKGIASAVKAEMMKRLQSVEWLDPATKREACAKLAKLTEKIGCPDQWNEYPGMVIPPGNHHLQNVMIGREYHFQQEMDKINRPTNKSQWLCSPAMVNAFYHPSLNEIIFPAAFLVAPLFDPEADLAVQYGTLGAMVGHEISHGFDEIGRKYDGDGNVRDWWNNSDKTEYSVRKQIMVMQMERSNVFVPFDGHITSAENLADLSGLDLAIGAFQTQLEERNICVHTRIDGFTPWQRFFLSWAKTWREVRQMHFSKTATTVHGPNEFRCNNPLKNMTLFYEKFNIPEGCGMYLAEEDRVKIW